MPQPKINPKGLKIAPKMQDPPRYPKVISGYESDAKNIGEAVLKKIMVDITDKMIKTVKK